MCHALISDYNIGDWGYSAAYTVGPYGLTIARRGQGFSDCLKSNCLAVLRRVLGGRIPTAMEHLCSLLYIQSSGSCQAGRIKNVLESRKSEHAYLEDFASIESRINIFNLVNGTIICPLVYSNEPNSNAILSPHT
jgi:hypothetical protein